MLRITYARTEKEHNKEKESSVEQRWTLCGQLTGPWVQELRACFAHHRQAAESNHTIVDLSDVTFIDESGEMLLAEMRNAGAEFVAAGVDTKHLLKNLKARGERPLRRFNAPLGWLCGDGRDDNKDSKMTKGEEK